MICPYCLEWNDEEVAYCGLCGKNLSEDAGHTLITGNNDETLVSPANEITFVHGGIANESLATGIEGFLARGKAFYKAGLYEEAILAFDEALAIYSIHTDALYWKADALLKLQRFQEAHGIFSVIVILDPQDRAAWWGKYTALKRMGRREEASEAFRIYNYPGHRVPLTEDYTAQFHKHKL